MWLPIAKGTTAIIAQFLTGNQKLFTKPFSISYSPSLRLESVSSLTLENVQVCEVTVPGTYWLTLLRHKVTAVKYLLMLKWQHVKAYLC